MDLSIDTTGAKTGNKSSRTPLCHLWWTLVLAVAGFLFGFQKGPLNIKTIWGLKLGEHVAVQHC
ncbi:hypothetical protein Scep_013094 [Stephania cephalantha]|uniref:Uncharacterized protein n=1 Tax=Stephania cephalantha TaxID=152367 RepID=A0AAP0JGE1_9MAGN